MPETEIAETLDEVRAHEAATGTAAEAEFGTAEEYAKQFPKNKRRTLGSTIVIIGAALATAYILLTVLLMFSELTFVSLSARSRSGRGSW